MASNNCYNNAMMMIGLMFDISDLTYNNVNETLNKCISYTLPTGIIAS